jgi:hypothetical protein
LPEAHRPSPQERICVARIARPRDASARRGALRRALLNGAQRTSSNVS